VDHHDDGVRACSGRELEISALAAVLLAIAVRPPWPHDIEHELRA
jgi:hypothetical protein